MADKLENIWIEIDERAKRTDSVFTALTNQVASRMIRLFATLYGRNMLSWKLGAVFANLSVGVAEGAQYWLVLLSSDFFITGGVGLGVEYGLNNVYWIPALIAFGVAALAIWSSKRWVHILCLTPLLTGYSLSLLRASHNPPYRICLF